MAVRRSYQRFYVTKDDVPENMGKDEAIIYKQPERIYGYDDLNPMATFNIKGLNYQNTSKELMVHNLVFLWKQIAGLRVDLTSEKVKNKILTRRLVEHNIHTTLSPDEVQDYELNLRDILTKEVDMSMSSDITDIRKEILNRVRSEIGRAESEIGNNYQYNIVRLNDSLKYNDILLEELHSARGRQMKQKDRIKAILDIEKQQRENMDKLKEILKECGISLRDTQTEEEKTVQSDTAPQQSSMPNIKLGSFLTPKEGA